MASLLRRLRTLWLLSSLSTAQLSHLTDNGLPQPLNVDGQNMAQPSEPYNLSCSTHAVKPFYGAPVVLKRRGIEEAMREVTQNGSTKPSFLA